MRQEVIQQTPAIETYSKRAQSFLKQAFNKAQLPLVGGDWSGQIPREREYAALLVQNPYTGLSTVEGAAFTINFPQVMGGLLVVPDDSAERYMAGVGGKGTGIGGHDFHNLPEMARTIAEGNKEAPVAIRVVFGGTPDMQFRGLTMLLPALQQMEAITEAKHATIEPPKAPQLQVVFANHIAAHINGLNLENLQKNTREFIDVAEAYVGGFFPQLRSSVVFLEDAPVTEGSIIKDELDRLTELADRVLPDELKAKLSGKRNGQGNGTSLRYAAAHVLVHDTNNQALLRNVTTNRASAIIPEQIISIGGSQERDFYEARHHLRPHAGSAYQLPGAELFTRHGSAPYYPARGGDISLIDALRLQDPIDLRNLQGVDRHVELDINYFLAVSDNRGGREKTDAFIKELRERKAA